MFHPQGVATGGNREKYTPKEYLLYGSLGLLVLGLVVIYALELEYFPLYSDVSSFLIFALIGGLLIGLSIAYYLREKAENATETMQIYIACILTSLIFAPLFFSLTNRLIALDRYEKEVQIISIEKRYTSRVGLAKGEKPKPNIFLVRYLDKGKSHKFSTRKSDLENAKRGDKLRFNFKRGLLGFEYILPD